LVVVFSSRRRHTRCLSDWSSDVCSSDLELRALERIGIHRGRSGQRLEHADDERGPLLLRRVERSVGKAQGPADEACRDEVVALEIGRASCRERGVAKRGGGGVKENDSA